MKVEGPRGPGKIAAPKKTARTGGTGFAEALRDSGDGTVAPSDGEVEAVHGAVPATSLDALLAIQGVESTPDATEDEKSRDRKARDWGDSLLDRLDEIRRDLLTGDVPPARLSTLAEAIGRQKEKAVDPDLRAVLSEIELRARVELAKLSRR